MRTETSDFLGLCALGHEHQRYSEVHPAHDSSSSTTIVVGLPRKRFAKEVRLASAIMASFFARILRMSGGIGCGREAAIVPGRWEKGYMWGREKGLR